jgi:hypothetical protein
MSLRAFHVVFIALSCLLALGFGAWCLGSGDERARMPGMKTFGGISLSAGAGLIIYGFYFVRKMSSSRGGRGKPGDSGPDPH